MKHFQAINKPRLSHVIGAGASMLTVLLIGTVYLDHVQNALFGLSAEPASFRLLMNIVIAISFVEVIKLIVNFLMGSKLLEKSNTYYSLVSLQAMRNSYLILSFGVILCFEIFSIGMTAFQMANCLLLIFVLSEMVKYGTQMLLYLYPNLVSLEADSLIKHQS